MQGGVLTIVDCVLKTEFETKCSRGSRNALNGMSLKEHRMKKIIGIAITALSAILAGCADFPTSYERIGEGEIRVLDFTYEPAEAAPGDSITLTAIIAGESIGPIDWNVSWNVVTDKYGTETAINYQPLQYIDVQAPDFSSARTTSIRFRIPEDLLEQSAGIPDNWIDAFPLSAQQAIPDSLKSIPKQTLLQALALFAAKARAWDSLVKTNPAVEDSLMDLPEYRLYKTVFVPMAPAILQAFTARLMIQANINGYPDVRSRYTVRYNSKLTFIPHVYKNSNPAITRMGIYRVEKANLSRFDPNDTQGMSFESITLFDRSGASPVHDTVVISDDCSYFLFAQSDTPDSAINLYQSGVGTSNTDKRVESHFFKWFFTSPVDQVRKAESDELMSIINTWNTPVVKLIPPACREITSVTIWSQVYDEFMNERLRPEGSSVAEAKCMIIYE
jgi:hypothetical protein